MKTGLSIFTGLKEYTLEQSLKYLEYAHEHNIEMIFSSAHINEADRSIEELNIIIEKCYEYGMKFVIDVSKKAFENLGLSDKVYAYRLDYGFTDEEIVELSKSDKFYIELNASTLSEEKLLTYIEKGINLSHVRASFNYYPKLYTGHDIQDARHIIKMFNKYGINVGAFLPSTYQKRPPMYEGLPSIESHRYLDKGISIEELKAIGVSEVFIGDAYASCEEIVLLEQHRSDDVVLDLSLDSKEDNDLFSNTLTVRPDYNNYLIRLSGGRGKNVALKNNKVGRNKFDVTIDNELFKRYSGEVNIVINQLPNDERVNVIGKVKCSDIIISKIKENKKIKFNLL
jgi:hypothetical protein